MITSYFKAKKRTRSTGEKSTIEQSNESADVGSSNHTSTIAIPDDTSDNNANKRLKRTTASFRASSESIELISHIQDDIWRNKMSSYFEKPSFLNLATFIASERLKKTVYPPPCDVFSALNTVAMNNVKVVIVGQDPYHQPNQGHGLAFSVRKGIRIPPSLRNIYKELLENDCGFEKIPNHGNLEQWCQQGVLLLNAVLTVRKSEANSHAKKGWEMFTDEVIRLLVSNKERKLVFLLWGKPASKKAETIINRYGGKAGHTIISTSHPSPLGATKTKTPFLGSKCFKRANEALVNIGEQPIDWKID